MTTPDIAGLCERLRKPLDYTLHLYRCNVDTTMANAADTLEHQAAEIERLRTGLEKVAAYYGPGHRVTEIAQATLDTPSVTQP